MENKERKREREEKTLSGEPSSSPLRSFDDRNGYDDQP